MKKVMTKVTLKFLCKSAFCLFSFSFLAQFYICNRYAVKNDDLQVALEKRAELKKEIARLEYMDSKLSSLERVETEAMKLGFAKIDHSLLTLGSAPMASLNTN